MSSLSVHRAAQEGQTGLVKSLLSQDPKLANSKDAVSIFTLFVAISLLTMTLRMGGHRCTGQQ